MGALSVTWEPHYREPFTPLVPGMRHVRYNDVAALHDAIGENTAAVILEVAQGEGGVRVADGAYLLEARRLCDERGALLILDEVQTGFGRTGRLWACEHAGVTPDILCLAKGIAGGLPMGATCVGPRVPSLPVGAHGSTFGGNPLACAAALATLDVIQEQRLPEQAAASGAYLRERLDRLAARAPRIREVRGLGLMLGGDAAPGTELALPLGAAATVLATLVERRPSRPRRARRALRLHCAVWPRLHRSCARHVEWRFNAVSGYQARNLLQYCDMSSTRT